MNKLKDKFLVWLYRKLEAHLFDIRPYHELESDYLWFKYKTEELERELEEYQEELRALQENKGF